MSSLTGNEKRFALHKVAKELGFKGRVPSSKVLEEYIQFNIGNKNLGKSSNKFYLYENTIGPSLQYNDKPLSFKYTSTGPTILHSDEPVSFVYEHLNNEKPLTKIDIEHPENYKGEGLPLISKEDAELLANTLVQENYLIEFTTKTQTASGNVIIDKQSIRLAPKIEPWFIEVMTTGTYITDAGTTGSDVIDAFDLNTVTEIRFNLVKEIKGSQKYGGFFNKHNTTDIDLRKSQIYRQSDKPGKQNQCLIHSLLQGGVDPSKVNTVALKYTCNNIPKRDLKEIAEIIGCQIVLSRYDKDGKVKKARYGKGRELQLAIHNKHYFVNEMTQYSKYFIDNYEDLRYVVNGPNIIRKFQQKSKVKYGETQKGLRKQQYTYSDKTKVNTLYLVNKFDEKGLFVKGDMSKFNINTTCDEDFLDNMDEEQREFVAKKKNFHTRNLWFADIESFVHSGTHSMYMLGYLSTHKSDNSVIIDTVHKDRKPEQVIWNFLNTITNSGKDEAVCYFHNLKYDYTLMEPYLHIADICKKESQLYSVTMYFKGCKIQLRDSYKFLSCRLSDVNSLMSLDEKYKKLEAIAYKYYTLENHNKQIHTYEYRKYLSNKDKEIFDTEVIKCASFKTEPFKGARKVFKDDKRTFEKARQNTKDKHKEKEKYEAKIKANGTFNPYIYYKNYLKNDVLVLKHGINKLDTLLMNISKDQLSLHDALTIASFTDKFMIMRGAYDGVWEVKGGLRKFVAKTIYGGRVHCNTKYVKQTIVGKIADFDGVSLYPSAINRMCEETGLPLGPAKRLGGYGNLKCKDWQSSDYCCMKVLIKSVNKEQQMPMIVSRTKKSKKATKINKKGEIAEYDHINEAMDYTNNCPSKPVYVDKITLEDYIKFHEVEYEVLDGVYWDEGFNKTMGVVVRELFSERLKVKKMNPALGNVLKLMLNSSYGKTITKPSHSKIKFVGEKDLDSFVIGNFGLLKSYRKAGPSKYAVEVHCADKGYNRAHIGCNILSMSKRIMNEVFDLANTMEAPIYYTDTDSIHIDYDCVVPLANKYKEVYGRELEGSQMGQFHIDFALEGAVESSIYADRSIFLGKKSYYDHLVGVDKEGKPVEGCHYRLKGITKEGLLSEASKLEGIEGLYESLKNGNSHHITLNPINKITGEEKVLFEFGNGVVKTKPQFIRKVNFE